MSKSATKMNKLDSTDSDLMQIKETWNWRKVSFQISLAQSKFMLYPNKQKKDVVVSAWAKKNQATPSFHHVAASEVLSGFILSV